MLERDVYNLVCSIIAGYERRKKEYEDMVDSLSNPLQAINYSNIGSGGQSELTPTEAAVDKKLEYEKSPNARMVHAVDLARNNLESKYEHELAKKLFKAISLNTYNRHDYPYHVLNRTLEIGYSNRQFTNIKSDFIDTIADYLDVK